MVLRPNNSLQRTPPRLAQSCRLQILKSPVQRKTFSVIISCRKENAEQAAVLRKSCGAAELGRWAPLKSMSPKTIFPIAVLFFLNACVSFDPCGNSILNSIPSPSGKFNAVLFKRDCGATTGFSTHLSILQASEALDNQAGKIAVFDELPSIDIKWRDERHLVVRHPATASVFLFEKKFGDIQIIEEMW
jgi:hypothetical protein